MVRVIIVATCISIISFGCRQKDKVDEDALAKKAYEAERNPVDMKNNMIQNLAIT